MSIRCVLHATDFSADSESAFRLACSLARDYGARLVLVHVVPQPVVIYGEGVFHGGAVVDTRPLQERLAAQAREAPELLTETRIVEGDAAEEILRVAREVGCDLIVMGTHGRTGLRRLLMGSVAEKVLRHAQVPVLILKSAMPAAGEAGQPPTPSTAAHV